MGLIKGVSLYSKYIIVHIQQILKTRMNSKIITKWIDFSILLIPSIILLIIFGGDILEQWPNINIQFGNRRYFGVSELIIYSIVSISGAWIFSESTVEGLSLRATLIILSTVLILGLSYLFSTYFFYYLLAFIYFVVFATIVIAGFSIQIFIAPFHKSAVRKAEEAAIHTLDDRWYNTEKIDTDYFKFGFLIVALFSLNVETTYYSPGGFMELGLTIVAIPVLIAVGSLLFIAADESLKAFIAVLALIGFIILIVLFLMSDFTFILDKLLLELVISMGLILFYVKCFLIIKDGDFAIRYKTGFVATFIALSTIIIAKPIYTFGGFASFGYPGSYGLYHSDLTYLLISIMVFSIQRYLLYYINANNEESEAKSDRDINIGKPYILGSVSVFLLVYLLGLPLIYYIISAIYVLITYFMNNYKSIDNINIDYTLVIFLLVYLFLFNNPFHGIVSMEGSLESLVKDLVDNWFLEDIILIIGGFLLIFVPDFDGEELAFILSFIAVTFLVSPVLLKKNFNNSGKSKGNLIKVPIVLLCITLLTHFYIGDKTLKVQNYDYDDYVAASDVWRTPAENGNALAQYNMALINEGRKRTLETYKWYKKSADQNYAPAQFALGLIHQIYKYRVDLEREGIDIDPNNAYMFFKKAADQNYPPAIDKVADYYAPGLDYKINGVDKDAKKAIELYTKALELGNYESYVYLGIMLVHEGLYEKAKKLYANPAPGHLKYAMKNMGYVKKKLRQKE